MTEEYSYALTWEAATERLEAAGCITVKEAEAMEELHASDKAGIDVSKLFSHQTFCIPSVASLTTDFIGFAL